MKHKIPTGVFKLMLIASATLFSASSHAVEPVIMIPGTGGWVSLMDPMKNKLAQNGWPANRLYTWTDADQMNKDIEASARTISAKVDQVLAETGEKKVVLATWSASTIAARYYIKNLGGAAKGSNYIAYADPQHGITNWQQCTIRQTAGTR